MPNTKTTPGPAAERQSGLDELARRVAKLEASALKPQGYRDVLAAVDTAVRSTEIDAALRARAAAAFSEIFRYSTPDELANALKLLLESKQELIVRMLVQELSQDYSFKREVAEVLKEGLRDQVDVNAAVRERVDALLSNGERLEDRIAAALLNLDGALARRLATSGTLQDALWERHRQLLLEATFRMRP